MSNYTHGSAVIHVFLDVFRLRDGQRFDEEFASALIKTTVVMPLFSIDALERMFKHDKRYPDNVLLEWIMANECLEASNSGSVTTNVKTIYPIFFGERVKNATTGDTVVSEINFAKLSNDLPDIIPEATIARAKEILHANGITTFSARLDTYTVRAFICDAFSKYLGMQTWLKDQRRLISEIATKASELISAVEINIAAKSNTIQNRPSASGVATKLRDEVLAATNAINNFDLAWEILQVTYIMCICSDLFNSL